MKSQKLPAAQIGASLVVLSSVFYASYGVWIALMGNFFGSFTASVLRCVLVFGMLVLFAMGRGELQKIEWRRDRKWLLIIFFSSILVSGPLYYAILNAGVGVGIAVSYVGIVIGMFFFGWLFNGERFTSDKLVATAFGILGLGLVFSPNIKVVGWVALLAALISGLAVAANMTTTKKIPYNGSQSTILLWGIAVLANIPMVFLLHEPPPAIGWHIEWLYMLLFAMASMTASWTFIRGLKLIEAGAAGILGLLEVVFGVIFGILFFNERPGAIVLLGMVCILIAAAIPYIQHFRAGSALERA